MARMGSGFQGQQLGAGYEQQMAATAGINNTAGFEIGSGRQEVGAGFRALAGMGNSMSVQGARLNQEGLQSAELQNDAIKQQIDQRKRIFDLLFGQFSKGGQAGDVQGLVDQIGQAYAGQEAARTQDFQDLANSTLARFQQYGMGGSSGVPSVLAGIERQKALSLGELNDQKIMNQVGVQERALDRAQQMQQMLIGILR